MGEACGNCRFGIEFADTKVATADCRRFPPKAGAMRDWPGVGRSDWCGEWKGRDSRVSPSNRPRVITGPTVVRVARARLTPTPEA